jgi:hypothetical protein
MMTRRSLIGLLAGAVLDPERLLWQPGKLISIPKKLVVGWDPGSDCGSMITYVSLTDRDGTWFIDEERMIDGVIPVAKIFPRRPKAGDSVSVGVSYEWASRRMTFF